MARLHATPTSRHLAEDAALIRRLAQPDNSTLIRILVAANGMGPT
jgi:hypothetical protein